MTDGAKTRAPRRKLPGVQMPFSDYAAVPAVNYSTLCKMAQSPLHYWYAVNHPTRETPAMLLGRACHTAVFEPDRFPREYVVWDGDRRGAAYTQFAESAEAAGHTVLRAVEYSQALEIRDAVRGVPVAAALLAKGRPEVVIRWTNPATGIECKGRLDWIAASGAIIDLKTTASIDPHWFAAHAWRMGYFHQAAMYQEGYAVASGQGTVLRCGIIAVEQTPPHACRLFWLDTESLGRAWDEFCAWLDRVKDCRASGMWPGPDPVESTLMAPAWAVAAAEDDGDPVDFDGI